MSRFILLIVWLGFAPALSVQAQTCAQVDYTLTSQNSVDLLAGTSCSAVSGNLTIQNGTDIIDLSELSNIRSVGGSLKIDNVDNLTMLDGLQNITSIGGSLSILNNARLRDASSLLGMTSISADLVITNNASMTSPGLLNLSSVAGNVTVSNNPSLYATSSLFRLASIGGSLTISENDGTGFGIDELSALETLGGDLVITGNNYLYNVDGLSGITAIGGALTIQSNLRLGNVDGLSNLDAISGNLLVESNGSLGNCLGLVPVLGYPDQSDNVSGTILIRTNASGCNSVNDIFATVTPPGQPTITSIRPGDGKIILSVAVIDEGSFPVSGYRAVCTDGSNSYLGVSGVAAGQTTCPISLDSTDRMAVTSTGLCAFSGQSSNRNLNNSTATAVFTASGPVQGSAQISSESCCDVGRLRVNNSIYWSISGSQSRNFSYNLGESELRFTYEKDGSVSSGTDTFSFSLSGQSTEQPFSPGTIAVDYLENGTEYTCTVTALSRAGESVVSPASIPVAPVAGPDPAVLWLVLNSGARIIDEDTDGDGFMDDMDQCPETPGDEPTGCPTFEFLSWRYLATNDSTGYFESVGNGGCYPPRSGTYAYTRSYYTNNIGVNSSVAEAVLRVRNDSARVNGNLDSAYGDYGQILVNGRQIYIADGPYEDYDNGFDLGLNDGDVVTLRYTKNGSGNLGYDQMIFGLYGGTVCGGIGLLGETGPVTGTSTNSPRTTQDGEEASEEPQFGSP